MFFLIQYPSEIFETVIKTKFLIKDIFNDKIKSENADGNFAFLHMLIARMCNFVGGNSVLIHILLVWKKSFWKNMCGAFQLMRITVTNFTFLMALNYSVPCFLRATMNKQSSTLA